MPEKIIKQTLSEQIYNILKEDILSGRIFKKRSTAYHL